MSDTLATLGKPSFTARHSWMMSAILVGSQVACAVRPEDVNNNAFGRYTQEAGEEDSKYATLKDKAENKGCDMADVLVLGGRHAL